MKESLGYIDFPEMKCLTGGPNSSEDSGKQSALSILN